MLTGAVITRRLGQGYYGSVFEAQLAGGKTVAIKTQLLISSEGIQTSSVLEADALNKLRDTPAAIRLEGLVVERCQIKMILQPMTCNLIEYTQRLSLEDRKLMFGYFLRSMLSALVTLEGIGIQHFDIKPSNILVGPGTTFGCQFKLADFGLARGPFLGKFSRQNVYTLWLRPPEYLSDFQGVIPPFVSDVWALGVTGWYFLTREYLFQSDNPSEILNQILSRTQNGVYQLPSEEFPLLQQMMTFNPMFRPRASVLTGLEFTHIFPDPVRVIPIRWLRIIWQVNLLVNRSPIVYIITVELLGRFLDSIGFHPPGYVSYIIAAHHLASAYMDNPPVILESLISFYRSITGHVSSRDVHNAIFAILGKVNFQVYNPNLTLAVKRWVEKSSTTPINSFTKEHYLQPVKYWFL